ncbi:DUF5664 domain-containing protein [Xinfangfangia sp. CPCC 101601]|uniref:DUF5664 domain-containing protein n=1 Tax=Pseudogemmobacter lacusdianii TaxID=3069608 RepID=A0ABU0VYB5_9RHOB|nr:dATP/dGTP diphosphohydrolase domain-containing protein [Xinfangfangia sp. CPCC 101601]MDQ2066722.1 DUF5664 domain-containing protein [Xinfangfangia sp. CPCC 101601]
MDTFKVGDLVECVSKDPLTSRLHNGNLYTITRIANGFCCVWDEYGDESGWYPHRFKKVGQPTAGINPKDAIGSLKPSLRFVPMAPIYMAGEAMADGAEKYGPFNWREQPVNGSVYFDAAQRHLNQWFHGNDRAEDSNVHHLAHAIACLLIILDAETQGTLNDDRPKIGKPLDDFIAANTKTKVAA